MGTQYQIHSDNTYDIVEQDSTVSVFGVYFSLGGIIKVSDLIYLLPEVYATVYPFAKTDLAPEETFNFITTEIVSFGFNFGITFKLN